MASLSFSCTTILYGSAHKRLREYNFFYFSYYNFKCNYKFTRPCGDGH